MGDIAAVLARLRLGEAGEAGQRHSDAAPGRRGPPRIGRQESITIGHQHFQTVDEAWDHISAVKRRLLGRSVRPGDPDFEFLAGLLARHPKGAAKVEHPPVREFTARTNVSGRGIEFRFVDSAGQEHDFSAKKCMEQRDEPLGSKLRRAMELAVQQQREAFRAGAAADRCKLCGSASSLRVDCDDPPLLKLCTDFLADNPSLKSPTHFAEAPSGGAQFRPEDGGFASAWRAYHRVHASMRLLCQGCEAQENARRGIRPKGAVLGAYGQGRGRGHGNRGRGGRGYAGRAYMWPSA